ncbi:hypothetical protein IAT38_002835 [Cryptococcus sp. DSM 104549]
MNSSIASPGPSRAPRVPAQPFVSALNRPDGEPDGIFRVVLITSGSVASIKAPDIVGALAKTGNIDVQVVATKASTHFYSQEDIDKSVRGSLGLEDDYEGDVGVRVWTDEDEWADWKKVGEPILHIELRRWADLVVVAPCSADMLAKIAGGICDSLATSLLRALSPTTPVVICPAMNTHMYQHKFTAKHLAIVQKELNYLVSGPQGTGTLACGDEGPGKMTDWRDIVSLIEGFVTIHESVAVYSKRAPAQPSVVAAQQFAKEMGSQSPDPNYCPSSRPGTPTTPILSDSEESPLGSGLRDGAKEWPTTSLKAWNSLTDSLGGDGSLWKRKWWSGL